MKILSGEWRGRSIKTTEGPGYRPAMSKVRAALFSMLESRGIVWSQTRILDLYAGSGSLGFEALSRGAKEVCFVENSPKAAALIRKNANLLGALPEHSPVIQQEVNKVLGKKPIAPYDIIFIDPPYGKNLFANSVRTALRQGWLSEGGILNAEIEGRLAFSPETLHPELEVLADRKYGQTRVVLWMKKMVEESQFTPEPSTHLPTDTSV